MAHPLIPCPSCNRHVRAAESACPFCAAALPTGFDQGAVPAASGRLGRAAAFVFTASLGASLSLTACGSDVSEEGASSAGASGSASGTSGTSTGGPYDDGGIVPPYGLPPPPPDDAGPVDPPPPDDAGTGEPEDAGPNGPPGDDGGAQPLYGAPPPPQP